MIRGSNVILRPATEADRAAIYEWLTASDLTCSMFGPPLFPDEPPPTWEEFCTDYAPHFFDGSAEEIARSFIIEAGGVAAGHVNYDGLDPKRRLTELDIWMRSEQYCGRGYGSDALRALTGYLHEQYDVRDFLLRPSQRNGRAIAAYKKAGFVLQQMTQEEQAARYGPGDYDDAVVMLMRIPP